MSRPNFQPGDKVKMKYYDGWATGEITIVTDKECKVIWDGGFDLDYWYYPKKDLLIIKKATK